MKPTEKDIALLFLVRKKQGNWTDAEAELGAEMLSRFKKFGYLDRVNDHWQITNTGRQEALRFVFSCNCF